MGFEQDVLAELRELKAILAALLGTAHLPKGEQFSKEALEKVSKQFRKMEIERGEWLSETDMSKVLKGAPYQCGKFLIEHFQFTNYFKYGRTLYFNKAGLVALNLALKERNVNIARYIELKREETDFRKKVDDAGFRVKGGRKKGGAFSLPKDAKNVQTSEPTMPDIELVRQDIIRLRKEFKDGNFQEYIDVYRGSFAMLKYIYPIERYMPNDVKKRCKRWVDDFNYAVHAYKVISNRKIEVSDMGQEESFEL